MNGFVEKNIIGNPKSAFMKNLAKQSKITDQIEYAFQAILQRKPNSREMNEFRSLTKTLDTKDPYKDVAWVLLNSHEFLL